MNYIFGSHFHFRPGTQPTVKSTTMARSVNQATSTSHQHLRHHISTLCLFSVCVYVWVCECVSARMQYFLAVRESVCEKKKWVRNWKSLKLHMPMPKIWETRLTRTFCHYNYCFQIKNNIKQFIYFQIYNFLEITFVSVAIERWF